MYDPTDGCPGCGTVDRNHDPRCLYPHQHLLDDFVYAEGPIARYRAATEIDLLPAETADAAFAEIRERLAADGYGPSDIEMRDAHRVPLGEHRLPPVPDIPNPSQQR